MKLGKISVIAGAKLLLVSLLIGATHETPPDGTDEIQVIEEQASERKDQYFLYLIATYQFSSGKAQESFKTYQSLFKYRPSPHAYSGFLNLLSTLGQFKSITSLYEQNEAQFEKAFGQDIAMQLIRAQAYLGINQDAKAEKIFTALSSKHPDSDQVAYFTTIAYIKNNQLDKAMDFIDKCLKKSSLRSKHFLFHFLKSKIYIQQKKLTLALKEIEKSLQFFPRFDRGWLFKAMLLEQMGNINDAINGYKKFLDLTGRDMLIEKQLVQLLFAEQRFSEALKYMKRMKTNSPDYYFDLAVLELKSGNQKHATVYIDKAIKLSPTFNKARLLKAELLLRNQKTEELLAFMHDWITCAPEDLATIQTMVLLRKTGVASGDIIEALKAAEKIKPHINIVAAIADLSLEANNYDQAIAYYRKIADETHDQELKSKTLFHIGYIYFVQKKPALMESMLEQAIKCSQVYPSAYNLLAYHYAESNKNLEEALSLANKAIASSPQCYYYLDTKGYVLHRLGKDSIALKIFDHALTLAPHDSVIQQHRALAQERLQK